MTIGMFFSLISVQNIGAAYRHIQGGLGAAPDQVSWVVTSFLIAETISRLFFKLSLSKATIIFLVFISLFGI